MIIQTLFQKQTSKSVALLRQIIMGNYPQHFIDPFISLTYQY